MATTADIKKGITIMHQGNPHVIVDAQFVNPGKGSSFVRTKLKNITTGQAIDITMKAGDSIDVADTSMRNVSYLYRDDNNFYFMDPSNYEQLSLPADIVGVDSQWMKEGVEVQMTFLDEAPLAMQLPRKVDLLITETPPGVKGDTATGGMKQATLETGARVQVPLFLADGDVVRVNTENGTYVERV
ncbi:MAG: elongation factor P [bacterium]|nr:elongation factor P [bacterium]